MNANDYILLNVISMYEKYIIFKGTYFECLQFKNENKEKYQFIELSW